METGWLLDDGLLCVGATLCGFRMVTYTSPDALRFSRKEDAERFRIALVGIGMRRADANKMKPIDHQWG
jgi:hypothetical protein